jgi:hypothetical protein
MGNLGGVEQLGEKAQKRAIQMSVEGMSSKTIMDNINAEFNADLTHDEVRNFLRRKETESFKILKDKKNFQTDLAKQYFSTVNQMKELNTSMWELFYNLQKNPEYKEKHVDCPFCKRNIKIEIKTNDGLLKTANTILEQIKHVDTVLGRVQNKQLNITYNYTDLSKKIAVALPKLFDRAEKLGMIKIKRKRLKNYDEDVETEEGEICPVEL